MGTINEQIRACLKPPADTTGTGIIAPEKSVPEKQSKGDQIPPPLFCYGETMKKSL